MNVLIVPAGSGQLDLIKYCLKKQHKVYTLDDDDNAIGHKYSNNKLNLHTSEIKDLKRFVHEKNAKILTVASDFGIFLRSKILSNNVNHKKFINLQNKFNQKLKWCKLYNLPLPQKVHNISYLTKEKKYIIKPIFGRGSKNIFLIKSKKEAFELKNKINKKEFFIEPFIRGKEYTFEGFKLNKKITFFMITKKEKTYFSVSHLIYNHDLSFGILEESKNKISNFITKINYPDGPFHAELIIEKNNINLVEVHPRCIGYNIYTNIIQKIAGIDLLNLEIKLACKRKINHLKIKKKFKYFCFRFFKIKKNGKLKKICIKKKKVKNVRLFYKLFFKKDDYVNFSQTDSSRFGYIYALTNRKIDLLNLTRKIENKDFKIKYYE